MRIVLILVLCACLAISSAAQCENSALNQAEHRAAIMLVESLQQQVSASEKELEEANDVIAPARLDVLHAKAQVEEFQSFIGSLTSPSDGLKFVTLERNGAGELPSSGEGDTPHIWTHVVSPISCESAAYVILNECHPHELLAQARDSSGAVSHYFLNHLILSFALDYLPNKLYGSPVAMAPWCAKGLMPLKALQGVGIQSGSPQVTLLPARRQTQLQRATSEETTWNLVLQGSGRIRLYDSKQSVLLHWDPFTGYCKANAFNLEATNLARLAHGSEASLGTGDLILIPAGYASQWQADEQKMILLTWTASS